MNIIAFDPGTSKTGWCRVDAIPGQVTYIDSGITPSTWEGFDEILNSSFDDYISIELIQGIMFAPRGGGANLLASAQAAGMLKGIVLERGYRYVGMTAREWRLQVCGKANAGDDLVKAKVPPMIRDFPKRSNDHVRDAAGLAIATSWHLLGKP